MLRRVALTTLAAAAISAPFAANAQGFSDATLRTAPQFVTYGIGPSGSKTTVSEFVIPVAFAMPIMERLTFDIATAFANSSVDADGGGKSTISGLTDTQLRLNYTFGTDAVVVTAGLNLPSGQYEVEEDKIAAAGQIGNDFLAFPVSSFGSGMAVTTGVAAARPLGDWNFAVGGSFRKSTEFGAYQIEETALRFEPATEMRLRAGVDRFVLGGRVVFGLMYSIFGEDACEGCAAGTSRTTYSTGDRLTAQAALDVPLGGAQLFLSGWMLQRGEGETVAGTAPPETILNAQAAIGISLGTFFVEPSVEMRRYSIDGESAGSLMYIGARTQFDAGNLRVSPSVGFSTGSIGVESLDLTGFRIGATISAGR